MNRKDIEKIAGEFIRNHGGGPEAQEELVRKLCLVRYETLEEAAEWADNRAIYTTADEANTACIEIAKAIRVLKEKLCG